MRYQSNTHDSLATGIKIGQIENFTPNGFDKFEHEYIKNDNPEYVVCMLDASNSSLIRNLESKGFSYVEFRIRMRLNIRNFPKPQLKLYSLLEVQNEDQLSQVFQISKDIFIDDRFIADNYFAPEVANHRLNYFIQKSFDSIDEACFMLINNKSKEILAFKTHKYLDDSNVLMYLGGVRKDMINTGLGLINTQLELYHLKQKGVTSVTTHISGSNIPIINLEIGYLKFTVTDTFIVLRKAYQ